MKDFEKEHTANLKQYQNQIAAIYRKYAEEITRLGANLSGAKAPFSFDDYPETKKLVDKLLRSLAKETNSVIVNAIKKEFALADENVNGIVKDVYDKGKGAEVLTPDQTARWFNQYTKTNTAAAEKFIRRQISGLNLSDRVWKACSQLRTDAEIVIEQGILEGRSAAEMAREVKAALNEPNRLFRRVRHPDGTLRLSEAAKNYHPGQGTYRSSYKNALRLTSTETNIAYRSAFHDRIQGQDWITGIEVRLSNNHTCKDGKGGYIKGWTDICDELKGVYPKSFIFTGWHCFCRCEQVIINQDPIKAIREFKKRITTAEQITELPPQFKAWQEANAERIAGWAERGTTPYFLRDNEKMLNK